jgi:hypothetical protein
MVLPGHSFSLPEESLKEKALYQIKITFSSKEEKDMQARVKSITHSDK